MNCRLCLAPLESPILSLGNTALANEFLSDGKEQDTFPLDICQCFECGHYQLSESVDPERLFRHYLYVAGTSVVNVQHFRDYAEDSVKRFNLKPGDLVVDIASNDGTLLAEFKRLGMRVLGVDPARNLATAATAAGIETIPEFFTVELARQIVASHGHAAFVTANNVLAHTDTIPEITEGVKRLLVSGGVFAFEVSYFKDVVEKLLFDTLYHEHSSYHLVLPLTLFFAEHYMSFFDVMHLPNHGGSIRAFVRNGPELVSKRIKIAIRQECLAGLFTAGGLKTFAARLADLKEELISELRTFKMDGKSIAVYGMPAKATTLCYVFGLDKSFIDFAVDDAVLKQGTLSPGLHIPVLAPAAIYERKPDVLLVLAWNFQESIKRNHAAFKGEWIVPLGGI